MNWKNIFNITLLELLTTVRSTVAFALTLIMPFLMVFIMGTVMKPTFEAAENKTEKFSVLYVNKDEGPVGTAFDTFIRHHGSEFLEVIEIPEENMEEFLISEEYPAAIIVPENLSSLMTQNETSEIQIIGSGKHPIEENTIEAFVNNFILWTNTQITLTDVIQEFDATLHETATANALVEIFSQYGNDFIEERVPEGFALHNLTSFQFFSASMLVFFLLTSGMGIGCSLIDDRNNKTFKRIHSFPVEKREYLMGKIIGNGIIAIFQAISIIIITHLVFGVYWGKQFLAISIIVLLVIFISSAIGIIFSKVMHSSGSLTAALTIIFWFMAFISGGFTGSPILGFASRFTINHWAFNSLTTLMTGGELKDIIDSLIVLFSMA